MERREFLLSMTSFMLHAAPRWSFHRPVTNAKHVPRSKAALKVLEHQGADVIVADMRMPGMDGMDLLKKVHRQGP